MELLNRDFTAQSVALATGGEVRKISDWATRGLLVGQKSGGGAQGSTRKYSFFNVMEFGVAVAAMREFNVGPARAFDLARGFSHSGSGHSGYPGDLHDDEPTRLPGLPYHYRFGVTYLVIAGDDAKVMLSQDFSIDLSDFQPSYVRSAGFMVLNLTGLFAEIMLRLALDWREVLDEAYPNQAGTN